MTGKTAQKTGLRWILCTGGALLALLALYALVTVIIDPLFHFHAPLPCLQYPIEEERYQNDGILRHFDYEGIITGSSLAEKFKTSEAEALFDMKFVKVACSGSCFKEINDSLARAYRYGKDVKLVIRALDLNAFALDKDAIRDDYTLPEYLYNSNPFDDVSYVFNKELFNWNYRVLAYTRAGNTTTSFDDYGYFDGDPEGNPLACYTLSARAGTLPPMSEAEKRQLHDNVRQNITQLAGEHPETLFYYFLPPVSVCYWDELDNDGELERQLEAIALAVEDMMAYPNIRLFSFINDFETVSDLKNYKDQVHYRGFIFTQLLEDMARGEYRMTPDNYRALLDEAAAFYRSYDYEALHGQEG